MPLIFCRAPPATSGIPISNPGARLDHYLSALPSFATPESSTKSQKINFVEEGKITHLLTSGI